MIAGLPKLRGDLMVCAQQTSHGTFFVVKDPVSGQYFRLGEAEQFIAQQFDGETLPETVRQRTEAKFDAELPVETFTTFMHKLTATGILETGETAKKNRNHREKRFRGSVLYFRFKAFDPARLLARLVRRTQLFYTPYFLGLSAVAIVLAAGVIFSNWSDFTRQLSRLYALSAIPAILAIVFLVVSAHEFAHALTCTHFGGEVHEMGFAVIYFQPAFYCNVSDAWLFPEKSKRLWVGFAGPYFELFVWAIATLIWRTTEPDTWINTVGLIVMACSGIKTLLNFNPFIKLDGYYLLSDYLEIPNLRRKSFRQVGHVLERLFGFGDFLSGDVPRRERIICFVYGVLALVGSFSILGYVFITAGGSIVDGRPPTAVLLSLGLLGLKYRRRFRRMFGKPSGASDSLDDGEDFEGLDRTTMPKPTRSAKKEASPRARRVVWMTVLGAGLAGLFIVPAELRVKGPFNVLPIDNSDVRAEVEGVVEQIYVHEGDKVQTGDVIARLFDKDLRAALEKTEAQVKEASSRLRMLETGPTVQEIEVAKAEVARCEDQLRYAQNRMARLKSLLNQGLLSRKEFEDSQDLATTTENNLVQAKARLNALRKSVRPEQIDQTRAQIEQFEADRRYINEQLKLLTVVSPSTGIVATPSEQLKEMTHQLVKKGDLIAKVYDCKTVRVEIGIPEKEIADVKVGQQVILKARAYPDELFYGTVAFIATGAQGESNSREPSAAAVTSLLPAASARRMVRVVTHIDNHLLLLKPEMTGQAKINCGQRRLAQLIRRRIARTLKVEFWSWW